MANVRAGTLHRAATLSKHLRSMKRPFWRTERAQYKQFIRRESVTLKTTGAFE